MRAEKKSKWRTLDNTAKIFPATSSRMDERVFRFACELNEPIVPEVLQEALDASMKIFPLFACVMRKGFFWYYLEDRNIRPVVEQEDQEPCSRIYVHDKKDLLFHVSYYKKRINLEVFHALTDGTGALEFLKTTVWNYLHVLYPDKVKGPAYAYDATHAEKEEDSFKKYYEKVDKSIRIPKYKSYQLEGKKSEPGKIHLIEGRISVSELLSLSRQYKTTMTIFLTAVYLQAIGRELGPSQQRKTVSLMIPVNLRKFFPSESARNFFGWIDIGYDFSKESLELSDIIKYADEFFKKELTKERLAARVNGLVTLEKNFFARMIPLEIKILGLRMGQYMRKSANTAVFSNVGKITMPEECVEYIKLFDVFTSTPKMELCMCSFQDNLVLSFTSAIEGTNVERNFFRILTRLGMRVEISAKE